MCFPPSSCCLLLRCRLLRGKNLGQPLASPVSAVVVTPRNSPSFAHFRTFFVLWCDNQTPSSRLASLLIRGINPRHSDHWRLSGEGLGGGVVLSDPVVLAGASPQFAAADALFAARGGHWHCGVTSSQELAKFYNNLVFSSPKLHTTLHFDGHQLKRGKKVANSPSFVLICVFAGERTTIFFAFFAIATF